MFLPALQLSHWLSTPCSNTQGCAIFVNFELPEVYKPPKSSKVIQSSTCLHFDNTSPRQVSTFTFTAAPGCSIPSRPLLFLYRLVHVHQEDRSSSLARSRPLLKNVITNAPSVSSKHFGCHRHLHRNIFVAQVIWLLRTCYPMHTQECAIQVHGKTCPASQLTADLVPFGTGSPLWHISFCGAVISRSCELGTATLPQFLCVERPLWAWFCSWCSVSL